MSTDNTDPSTAEEHGEETRWTDASIRWDTPNPEPSNDDDENDDGAAASALFDPFKDPDPTDTFTFRFARPGTTTTATDAAGSEGGESSSHGTSRRDSDAFIDIELRGFKADSDQIWDSTGLTLWRAAEHLCTYMVEHGEMLQNRRILELGAGLGLCGILAHRMASCGGGGGSNSGDSPVESNNNAAVFLTDGDTDVLAKLRDNVRHNKPTPGSACQEDSIVCRQLLWGRQSTETFLERHAEGRAFDVLLASDVVYVREIIQPLFETVQTLLRRPDGVLFFAYCSRRRVNVTIDFVLEAADEAGFSYECVEDKDGILIYVFRWKE